MPEFIPSAALILVAQEPELRVFLVRRAADQRFFPDQWTFPGGKLDAQDGPESDLLSFQFCAWRELLEETGLLPGFGGSAEALAALRHDLLNGKPFPRTLGLPLLQDVGWRVMPPFAPRRFETRYFLGIEPTCLQNFVLNAELSEAAWWKPSEVLAQWQQGKILVPPPVRSLVEILASHGRDLERLSALANDRKTLFADLQIFPGFEVIPLRTPTLPPATHTNCALIGREQFVIVDPASPYPEEQALLLQRIEARIAQGHQPVSIVLTHHHIDHMGGAVALRNKLQLPIEAHPETARLLAEQFTIDHWVEEGHVWNLSVDSEHAWILQAIHTPGHDPGHLCLLDLRQNLAHVGDMLAGMGTILIEHPEGNMQDYLDSLRRLQSLNLKAAIPSHGPVIHRPSQTCAEYLAHREMRENQILACLEKGAQTEDALLSEVYTGLAPQLLPLARRSLLAHLHKLKLEKRLEEHAAVWVKK